MFLFVLVDNMHKYTNEISSENNIARAERNRYTFRHYFNEESTTSVCYIVVVYIPIVISLMLLHVD